MIIEDKKMLEEEETEVFFAWNEHADQLVRKIRKNEYIKKRKKQFVKERSRQTNANKKRRRYFK